MKMKSWLTTGFVVAVALFAAAEPFPAEKLTGVWRMTKPFVIEVDPGVGTPTETEQRLTVTIDFLGGGRCKATFSNTFREKDSTDTFDFEYRNGEILFTKINGRANKALKDKLFGLTYASRFALLRKDDDTFEMRYADIPTLSRNWGVVGTINAEGHAEYQPDGYLKATTIIKAGGKTIKMTERHPPMVFKRIDASDLIPPPAYSVLQFGREEGNDFTYLFKLKFKDGASVDSFPDSLKRELKTYMVEDYAESFSDVDVGTLFVDFADCKIAGGILEGKAAVVTINVVAFNYSTQTRTGRMSVKFSKDQVDVARKYVVRNIAAIVRDKNIALVTGEVPPDATVRIENEEVRDGDVLEVVFRAVD